MGKIYSNQLKVSLTAGQYNCIELPAPSSGEVVRFVVKQIDGFDDGFEYDVLDRKGACEGEAAVSSSFDDIDLLDKEAHSILGHQVVAGTLSTHYDKKFGYQNQDEQDIRRTPKTRIYADIRPNGSGDKTFQIAYSIEPIETT